MKPVKRETHPQDPTSRDIREACERIRSEWTESERRRRAGLPKKEYWLPPFIPMGQVGPEMTEVDD